MFRVLRRCRVISQCRAACMAAMLVACAGPAWSSDKQEAATQWLQGMIQDALMSRNVEWLEKTSEQYRTKKVRMPSGRWSLETFYNTLERDNCVDPEGNIGEWLVELLQKWQQAYPTSPAPSIVLASCHYAAASQLRGVGYAHEIWDDNLAPMFENLKKAVAILQKNKALASRDPHWYAVMARTQLYLNAPDVEFWGNIETAIRFEPLYYSYYLDGFFRTLPRWGGSYAQAERWARRASARTSADYGDTMYARSALSIRRIHTDLEILNDFKFDWVRLKKGMLDMFETQQTPDFQHTMEFVEMSCAYRDVEQARKVWNIWKTATPDWPEFDPAMHCAAQRAQAVEPELHALPPTRDREKL